MEVGDGAVRGDEWRMKRMGEVVRVGRRYWMGMILRGSGRLQMHGDALGWSCHYKLILRHGALGEQDPIEAESNKDADSCKSIG